jgi:hypothetical protein
MKIALPLLLVVLLIPFSSKASTVTHVVYRECESRNGDAKVRITEVRTIENGAAIKYYDGNVEWKKSDLHNTAHSGTFYHRRDYFEAAPSPINSVLFTFGNELPTNDVNQQSLDYFTISFLKTQQKPMTVISLSDVVGHREKEFNNSMRYYTQGLIYLNCK